MSEQENVRIAKMLLERVNRGEIDFRPEYSHQDTLFEGPGAAGPLDHAQYRDYMQAFLDAFPDLHFDLLETVAQGNYVVINWRATATNTGPMRSPTGEMIQPTNRKGVVDGSTTYEFRGDKVARSRAYWDMGALMMQMGWMPQMGKAS